MFFFSSIVVLQDIWLAKQRLEMNLVFTVVHEHCKLLVHLKSFGLETVTESLNCSICIAITKTHTQ
jgi:hypothetical protein